MILPQTYFVVTYGVGQFLWTTFPDVNDPEKDYTQFVFDVASFDYAGEESALPPAESFFLLEPENNFIRSGVFESSHTGYHTLNVTIADSRGAQASFQIAFLVYEEPISPDQSEPYQLGLAQAVTAAAVEVSEVVDEAQEQESQDSSSESPQESG